MQHLSLSPSQKGLLRKKITLKRNSGYSEGASKVGGLTCVIKNQEVAKLMPTSEEKSDISKKFLQIPKKIIAI